MNRPPALNPRDRRGSTAHPNLLRDEFGVSVLLIEHDMKLVMEISQTISSWSARAPAGRRQTGRIRNPARDQGLSGRVLRYQKGPRQTNHPLRQDPGAARCQLAYPKGGNRHLIGPTGAGKTTLLMTLCGEPKPQWVHSV